MTFSACEYKKQRAEEAGKSVIIVESLRATCLGAETVSNYTVSEKASRIVHLQCKSSRLDTIKVVYS
ncbi:hypothetical protein GWI33_004381 [Rhynchophorus ferrugineus]|uniref:Uncharacterized protein n=1 Tax=Rhynchophorus ferrugineus TaxID=354439 RepID=A0A834IX79_RHYFE|nr:hypothetical protein GWI33_004381 [Rhynchophorus ferrugineus]